MDVVFVSFTHDLSYFHGKSVCLQPFWYCRPAELTNGCYTSCNSMVTQSVFQPSWCCRQAEQNWPIHKWPLYCMLVVSKLLYSVFCFQPSWGSRQAESAWFHKPPCLLRPAECVCLPVCGWPRPCGSSAWGIVDWKYHCTGIKGPRPTCTKSL